MVKVITSITIEQEHIDWVEKNSLNLSKFVRKKIDEAIKCQMD